MFTSATNVTDISQNEDVKSYSWSAWSSWSACSRTCGGGVAMQKRQCLSRSPQGINSIIKHHTADSQAGQIRVTVICHAPIPTGGTFHGAREDKDMRAAQCSSYDKRPFRGRFYTWIPYIDGDSPCILNCRPAGQQFYASLSLVRDGTPCTKPGYRAICVQGTCKVVGGEVLSVVGSRDVRCGRRLVSGLFARPRLPLGYSYVTTVPSGACRLNVSEILASDNYIALKITNGSFIMNGEFAVSSPGTYEAAGARFVYSRKTGLDSVYALGPTHDSIDIMILYTQPNPSIKYEYFTESLPGEVETESLTVSPPEPTVVPKHSRRHHGIEYARAGGTRHLEPGVKEKINIEENVVAGRKFVWKILAYTQCSRSCGGGIQLGKYRCVEVSSSDREVSPAHCLGSPPPGRRRRCGTIPCAPRWRAASWSPCPACGPATKNRIVGCVQDHSRGITKVSDQKCPAPKPATTEACNIPDCKNPGIRHTELKPQEHTDAFHDGSVYTVDVNTTDTELGPEYSFTSIRGWLFTDWSECVGWCVGGGLKTRSVRCGDPSGCVGPSPETSQDCVPSVPCEPHDGRWFTGDWSKCSSPCGKQVRVVLCIGGTGRHLRDSACRDPRPEHERNCPGECPATWYYSDWGQCTGNCSIGLGVQRRWVSCIRNDITVSDAECTSPSPSPHRPCTPSCIPPDLVIESQKSTNEQTTIKPSLQTTPSGKECEDKLTNCALAVQARLCHYKYYIHNCCDSCK
ncbi:unnamed protein product [Danaus chrysippus]|uniref:(African queen) hypothetical protein n=1 Tax=Danaus chrysippus TaxID=151541 RepID=A0A8J2W1P6_9NEOP|nr:unnamed protein product [Danaus chrysippus]